MNPSRRAVIEAMGVVTGALLASRAKAEPDDASARLDRELAEVARARASLSSLTGPFIQVRSIGLLSAKVRSTGTMTLVRPDRLRWDLLPPDAITYWVTPEGLAYQSSHGKGLVHGANAKIAAALEDLRVLLGGDLSLLRSRYDLVVSGPDHGPVTFDATPRAGAGVDVQRLGFALAPDRATPLSAVIVEGAKDRTEIQFGALVKNSAIDPARMRLP